MRVHGHLDAEFIGYLRIVRFVAEKKEDVPLEQIEAVPPILSLLCRELNERRFPQSPGAFGPPMAEIVFDEQETNVETILETFYERCVADRPEAVRIFIEEGLVSHSGIRLQNDEHSIVDVFANGYDIPGDEMGRYAAGYGHRDAATACLRELVNERLLSPAAGGENPLYELTHDLLCRIVYKSGTARQERLEKERLERRATEEVKAKEDAERRAEQEKRAKEEAETQLIREKRLRSRLRLALVGTTVLLFLALGALWFAVREKNRADKSASLAQERLARAQIEEGRAWIERAKLNSTRGDHFAAALMAARALGFAGNGREKIVDQKFNKKFPVLLTTASDPIDEQEAHRQIK
jgi:hypothetical protein